MNEYGRTTPYIDGGEYEWTHRASGDTGCVERDVRVLEQDWRAT